MSDNEYVPFRITDYDLANEFNPNRYRRKLTKNQQIYGIWAESENDSDSDDGPELIARRGKGRPAGPVSFVTGGIHQPGSQKKEDKADEENDADNPITDEDEDLPAESIKKNILNTRHRLYINSSSEEEEHEVATIRKGLGNKKARPPDAPPQSVGAWEQHTKGIGAKLLRQMGYKPGMGLGKDLQGISQPVQAHVRQGRGAIGAYGPEKPSMHAGDDINTEEETRESKKYKGRASRWGQTESRGDGRKKRYFHESVEEAMDNGKGFSTGITANELSRKLGNVPVIDMTGPETRVLNGYSALSQSKILNGITFGTHDTSPELEPESDADDDPYQRESSPEIPYYHITLRPEQFHLKPKEPDPEVELANKEIEKMEKVLALVDELTEDNEVLSLTRAEEIFLELQTDFPSEYKEFGLVDLAAGIVAPLIDKDLKSWKPLDQPNECVDTIKKWLAVLGAQQPDDRHSENDPYTTLIWGGVVPTFRTTITDWNPKNYQQMAALLGVWAPIFSTWVLDNVLEQLVLPRLWTAVKEWDPLTDTVPIHSWILPWNTILGHKMQDNVYTTIREKLGCALQGWSPEDRSARAMITPWKGVFEERELQTFFLRYIIPKLQVVLNELVINPLQQDLELWNQVWEWKDLITPLLMDQLLDKYFFPKWMQVLVLWLNQSPDYEQVSRWYVGWKAIFGDEIIKQKTVKGYLRKALEIMHRATENPSTQPTNSTLPIDPPAINSTATNPSSLIDMQIPLPVAPTPQLEFKELISQKCAERGIIFAPMPGRREFGKQVYRVGKLFCYIDRHVIMLSDGNLKNWTPTSVGLTIARAASD